MNSLLDAIDRYKYGLIAVLTVYIAIFIYLQMNSYTHYFAIEAFNAEGPQVEIPEDDIRLRPENILVPAEFSGDVKNMARDANDSRERSNEEYSANKSSEEVRAEYEALEQKMYEEAGGQKTRDQIREEMEKRNLVPPPTNDGANKAANNGSDNAYGGKVLADWELKSREPHQKNEYYIRKPGYLCENGSSGSVMVLIQVNQAGYVTSATVDASQSGGANSCMIRYALESAKKSRFSYSGSASQAQSGWINYTFVP